MSSPDFTQSALLSFIENHSIVATTYLDIGCGDGSLSIRIARAVNAKEIFGIDLVDQRAENAKTVTLKVCNIVDEKLPFGDNAFDLVTLIEVLEHIPYGDNVLDECYRILRPHGRLIVSTPNLSSWINRFLILFGYGVVNMTPSKRYYPGLPFALNRRLDDGITRHISAYNMKSLSQMLNISGFQVVDRKGIHWRVRRKVASIVDKIVSRRASLALDMIVLARKR